MTWKPEVDEINRRRGIAREHGGAERVEFHHARGKLTARERIAELLDAGSFRELGILAGDVEYDADHQPISFRPANTVMGTGRIDARRVVVAAHDATIMGGSWDTSGAAKTGHAEEIATTFSIPLVRLIESGGGSIISDKSSPWTEAVRLGEQRLLSENLTRVPVVAAALGPAAGIAAAEIAASHFAVMVRGAASVFAGGPPLVERSLGRRVTKEELGGVHVHAVQSGLIDNVVDNEAECFAQVRRFLGYLPPSAGELAPRTPPQDDPDRRSEALLAIIPRSRRRGYNARRLIGEVVDRESFFELSAGFGRAIITGLARIDGYAVGVTANDPAHLGGSMNAPAAEKLERFVELCETFHLPIITFQDDPGLMIGPEAEAAGTVRKGVRAVTAISRSSVPWFNIIVRKSYGVGSLTHENPYTMRFAWPSAEWGSLPVEGGVFAAFRREIEAAPDPDQRRSELEEIHSRGRSPFPRAEAFGVHDLIDPRETRPLLVDLVGLAYHRLERGLGSPPGIRPG